MNLEVSPYTHFDAAAIWMSSPLSCTRRRKYHVPVQRIVRLHCLPLQATFPGKYDTLKAYILPECGCFYHSRCMQADVDMDVSSLDFQGVNPSVFLVAVVGIFETSGFGIFACFSDQILDSLVLDV
jgi:hypothetical protein